jgi:phosphatidylglycerophosphatase C
MKYAIFDFDDTVVNTDSFFALIKFFLKRSRIRMGLAIVSAPIAILLLRFKATQRFGVSIPLWLGTVFVPRRDILLLARQFAETFEERGEGRLFPEAIQEMKRLESAGYQLLVVTAAPRLISRHLLFGQGLHPRIFGSTFAIFAGGVFQTRRCYGEVKVQVLKERSINGAEIGFTDSASDFPMLSLCQNKVIVNPSKKLLDLARARFPLIESKSWS